MNVNRELAGVSGAEYPEIYDKFRRLSEQAGGMPMQSVISAFTRATGRGDNNLNPYIQNRRVKQISTLPANYSKDEVADMITKPDGNEKPLRAVAHALEYTAYPLFHLRRVYQELMTYHSYTAPMYIDEADAKKDEFRREWRLLEKLNRELDVGAVAHQIAGQVLQEGKVFYYPRISVDKPHNKINHAFMQQLPSDWTKIVGFNNKTKYTVAFNLFYFFQPGADPLQFGDLFTPYLADFAAVTEASSKGVGTSVVFASKPKVDMGRLNALRTNGMEGEPDVYYQNGTWFYWVTLPPEKVFTFEVDDINRNVTSPFTGLFISLIQIAQYEQIQLELVQNPLISLITGEIPYKDGKDSTAADQYKLSDAGRLLFLSYWDQMLAQYNTSGVGMYFAPAENMTMHQLAEAPSATEISSNGYGYTMAKAGLSGIIPTTDDPRVGLASISMQIESRFASSVYRGMENMMTRIYERLNLKYEWSFNMFGSLAEDKETEESCRKGMTLGILSDTLTYLALRGRSLMDDLSLSNAVMGSGIMDKRLPLVSSYTAKSPDSGLPPKVGQGNPDAAHDMYPGGRPPSEGPATTEGQEQDDDEGV